MSLLRLKEGVFKLAKFVVVPKRGVSEYAKRFGYKIVEEDHEVKVNKLGVALCLLGSAVLIYDVAMDKQAHYETFMANYDANKKYMKENMRLDPASQPNMDFLVDQYFPPPLGDGKESTNYVVMPDERSGEELSPARNKEEVYVEPDPANRRLVGKMKKYVKP